MNDYHSEREIKYRPRWLAERLREAVEDHPVVVLTGARQTGKSTLLAEEPPFENWKRADLDDLDTLAQARDDPDSLWAGTDRIVIDEVQRAPGVLLAVKRAVDRDRLGIRFLLSGSANLLLMKAVSESLAGRAAYFTLLPLTRGEMEQGSPERCLDMLFRGKIPPEGLRPDRSLSPFPWMLKGFMPPLLAMKKTAAAVKWWEGYILTYLERDLRQLSQLDSLPDFRRMMQALALRSGAMLNQTEVARDIGVSQATVYRYINLLETTCLFERLPAFSVNRTKRLIKSPKIAWIDPGLAAFLCGYHEEAILENARERGGLFESLVYLHLSAWCQLQIPRAKLYYWRTVAGHEVDFVIEKGRNLLAIEATLDSSPGYDETKSLRLFIQEYPECAAAAIIHTGQRQRRFGEKIVALPWSTL